MITLAARTVGQALIEVREVLVAAGVKEARIDARLLLGAAIEADTTAVMGYPERAISDQQVATLCGLLARRADREPMSQILGRREFWSLEFAVTADTLTPRPDSETVIEAALAWVSPSTRRVLDLGTGTGCLLLALLHELPQASGVGVDISPRALAVATNNAQALALDGRARWVLGNWTETLDERFDLIVTNPPYIPGREIPLLDPEVARFEPSLALDGGADGLDAYRSLLAGVKATLSDGGAVFMEVGAGQAEEVLKLAEINGFKALGVYCDLAGVARCVAITRKDGDSLKKGVGNPAVPD